MSRPVSDQEAQFKQILDRLKITPQQLFDQPLKVGDAAVSAVDRITPDLVRADRPLWPPALFWRINLGTLHTLLQGQLDPLGVGYCYRIMRDGRQVHGRTVGWAQLGPTQPSGADDDGSVQWRFHVPMNVGSVSKFVTAIAVVRLLRDLNIPLTTPVANFLPAYWRPHNTLNQISFRALLRHESGLGRALNSNNVLNTNSGLGTFAEARTFAFTGGPQDGQRDYKNLNYALLRVTFAVLSGIDRSLPLAQFGIDEDRFWDTAAAAAYANYVNDVQFAAADIAPRAFKADVDAAKAYATPPVASGIPTGNAVSGAGSTGWHLSLGELTRLLDEFRRRNSILSPASAKRLLADLFGLDGVDQTRAGPVYRKGGRTLFQATNQGLDSAIYLMPDAVELAIFVNSVPPPPPPASPGTPPTPWPSHLDAIPGLIRNSIELGF